MEFWLICAWDQHYPNRGIENIKRVIIGTYSDAEKSLEEYKATAPYKCDYYEIFSSDELPWENK